MLYSEYVTDLNSWFWHSEWADIVRDKSQSKALARQLGLHVPREYPIPHPRCGTVQGTPDYAEQFVLKPKRGHSSQGVAVVVNPTDWLCEEVVTDIDGGVPPRNYQFHVFNGVAQLVQVHRGAVDGRFPSGWYTWPEWDPLRDLDRGPWINHQRPDCGDEMAAAAILVDTQFPPNVHVRTDLFWTAYGPVFSELCVTPGLAVGKRITPEGDRLLGSWLDLAN